VSGGTLPLLVLWDIDGTLLQRASGEHAAALRRAIIEVAALEAALALEPKHADAHTAMGMFHAEILAKVGALMGAVTYGAKREAGEEHLRLGMKLNPDSPIACIEAANGLVLLRVKKAVAEAGTLYARAAAMKPRDAMEKLDVDAAKAQME